MVEDRQADSLAISAVMIISPLDRKLLRDLARLKGQMLAVSVVMGCGLAMMICTRSLIHTLEFTRDAYYEKHRMADNLRNPRKTRAWREGNAHKN